MSVLVIQLLAILLFWVVLAIDVTTDYRLWLGRRPVNHFNGALIRIIGLFPSSILLYMPVNYSPVLGIISVIFMQFFVWVLFFDGIYNKIRGFDWWFTGSEDGDSDAILDKFWRRLGVNSTAVLKISGCVVGVAIYTLLCIFAV